MQKAIKELKEFENKTWKSLKGDILIKDMSTNHLKNVIKLLEKKVEECDIETNFYPSFQGEMAQLHAEAQYENSHKKLQELSKLLRCFKAYYYLKTL